ncbi:MAG TPA: thiamine phosphate synthase [Solirubrobacteraceae bacterium]|nr:thiamine phosphate synthase [Solirubrobacteraceae bacterium]
MPSIPTQTIGAERRARLAVARLYLVCPPLAERSSSAPDSASAPRELSQLLAGAIAGGVDVVQLREKHLPGDELTALARTAQQQCSRLGALLIVNDHPEIALAAGADGVHVGQDDMPAAAVRGLVGPELLIGLSTHSPAQIDQVDAALVDYIGVGPIHATPTKPGRPAVGLELVRYAAANAPVPFFAIGGIDAGNLAGVLGAGASRVCVLRAISDAADPERTARELRARLDETRASATPEPQARP